MPSPYVSSYDIMVAALPELQQHFAASALKYPRISGTLREISNGLEMMDLLFQAREPDQYTAREINFVGQTVYLLTNFKEAATSFEQGFFQRPADPDCLKVMQGADAIYSRVATSLKHGPLQ